MLNQLHKTLQNLFQISYQLFNINDSSNSPNNTLDLPNKTDNTSINPNTNLNTNSNINNCIIENSAPSSYRAPANENINPFQLVGSFIIEIPELHTSFVLFASCKD